MADAATKEADLATYALALADDALVLGHRLSEWSSHGPTLEEDIALSNLALDLIGQARLFYTLAGAAEGSGRSEDDLAYFRGDREYTNVLMVELPRGDFAFTMVRQLLYAALAQPYLAALAKSPEPRLAEIAAKAVKEMAYHVRHAAEWVVRLGDGTVESRRRTADALEELWPYTGELFETTDTEARLVAAGIVPDRAALKPAWDATIDMVLREATLTRPADGHMQRGGRKGLHSEHLGHMLAEMQVLARAHPGATW
jgi:ring-1,2-phenylacetyl-CoA epoxidase subunit PaaC